MSFDFLLDAFDLLLNRFSCLRPLGLVECLLQPIDLFPCLISPRLVLVILFGALASRDPSLGGFRFTCLVREPIADYEATDETYRAAEDRACSGSNTRKYCGPNHRAAFSARVHERTPRAQSKWIREVDRIAIREAIHIRPTGNPDGVLLRGIDPFAAGTPRPTGAAAQS